jgi:EpsI family protein
MLTRQGWVLAGVLAATCLLSHYRLYREIKPFSTGALDDFPERIGRWQMTARHPAGKREMELLETGNILSREYRDEQGREVGLALVYDPSGNRKMAHPQEICLTADGMQTLDKRCVELGDTGIQAERLLMENDSRRSLFYYWYKAGPHQSGSYVASQLRLAYYGLSGAGGGTALIRISTGVGQGGEAAGEAAGDAALADFGAAITREVDRCLP